MVTSRITRLRVAKYTVAIITQQQCLSIGQIDAMQYLGISQTHMLTDCHSSANKQAYIKSSLLVRGCPGFLCF